METCWLREDAALNRSGDSVIVGMGNAIYGDDGVGPAVARRVHDLIRHAIRADLLEHSASVFNLAERLVGYRRAVIIDALPDAQAEVGTVSRVDILDTGTALLSFHSAGFQDMLALAEMAGLEVPKTIVIYGITVRAPESFREGLSAELSGRLPEIAQAIAARELREQAPARPGT